MIVVEVLMISCQGVVVVEIWPSHGPHSDQYDSEEEGF